MDIQLKAYAEGKGKRASILHAIDAADVGLGVAEIIERVLPDADLYKVYVTGGISLHYLYDQREARLPKAQTVSTLVALFDDNTIHISKRSKEIDAIKNELKHF